LVSVSSDRTVMDGYLRYIFDWTRKMLHRMKELLVFLQSLSVTVFGI
jgi:hypothetical protein